RASEEPKTASVRTDFETAAIPNSGTSDFVQRRRPRVRDVVRRHRCELVADAEAGRAPRREVRDRKVGAQTAGEDPSLLEELPRDDAAGEMRADRLQQSDERVGPDIERAVRLGYGEPAVPARAEEPRRAAGGPVDALATAQCGARKARERFRRPTLPRSGARHPAQRDTVARTNASRRAESRRSRSHAT